MIEATLIDSMGSDLSVVNAARVSFGKNSEWECACGATNWVHDYDYEYFCGSCTSGDSQTLSAKDTKLVKYLAVHKHLSPFGHAFASFHVKAPIFVARQLVKHKFLRWNEISRRYVDDEPEFYTPSQWRGKSEDKKQGSSEEVVTMLCMGSEGNQERALPTLSHSCGTVRASVGVAYAGCLGLYKEMLESGVAPEQARMVLPQSLMTEWYWSGSMDSFANMCYLRLKGDTQYETRVVAQQVSEIMVGLYPVSWVSLLEETL